MKLFALNKGTPSDGKRLAAQAATGDVYATRALLERVAPKVVRSVQMVLGYRSADVDDTTQHALIAFIQALRDFRGECEPEWFAARIAVRLAVAARKRARFRAQHYEHDALPDETASSEQSPEQLAFSLRRQRLVRELLDALPLEQAEAIAMRFMLGSSLEEVAEASGVPVNTVRSRVRLAKDAILKRLAGEPELLAALELV